MSAARTLWHLLRAIGAALAMAGHLVAPALATPWLWGALAVAATLAVAALLVSPPDWERGDLPEGREMIALHNRSIALALRTLGLLAVSVAFFAFVFALKGTVTSDFVTGYCDGDDYHYAVTCYERGPGGVWQQWNRIDRDHPFVVATHPPGPPGGATTRRGR